MLCTLAPNSYNTEKVVLDSSPKYSFGNRVNLEKPAETPGIYYLLLLFVITANLSTANHTTRCLKVELHFASFSAPNVYNIPSALGVIKEGSIKAAPCYTISGRHKELVDERVKNPGPGAYNNVDPVNYKPQSPAYTISSRYNLPSDSTKVPGPGVYSPEKVLSWMVTVSVGERQEFLRVQDIHSNELIY